jgi:glutaredoxin 3
MAVTTIYSKTMCAYCNSAKALLRAKGIEFKEINLDGQPALAAELMQRTGRRTVPQIYIGEHHVGGFDDLRALDQAGRLDALLGIETTA